MESSTKKASAADVAALEPTDGLFLTGLIISLDRGISTWEGKSSNYIQIGVTDGSKTYLVKFSDNRGDPLPIDLAYGKRIRVLVTYAKFDKGNFAVQGSYELLN